MPTFSDKQRLDIAYECLRQIWQNYDAGGVSMGRSREAVWLETAIDLIPHDGKYSVLSDQNPYEFEKVRNDCRWEVNKEKSDKHYREMGLDCDS